MLNPKDELLTLRNAFSDMQDFAKEGLSDMIHSEMVYERLSITI